MPCKASNENDSVYLVRALLDCHKHVVGGLGKAAPFLTAPFLNIAIRFGAAQVCVAKVNHSITNNQVDACVE